LFAFVLVGGVLILHQQRIFQKVKNSISSCKIDSTYIVYCNLSVVVLYQSDNVKIFFFASKEISSKDFVANLDKDELNSIKEFAYRSDSLNVLKATDLIPIFKI
jgi:hypothetical protein